ncbi:MAG TPA: hypothetical protein GX401_09830 [Clostridiales bacterium]|nr:hypothetical protein [Clostridiales bacterium]
MDDNNSYYDLAERIEDAFSEIENDITVDFRENNKEYAALYQKISDLKAAHPIISKIMEGEGDISLTAEEHKAVAEYFRLQFKLESMEREQLYFRGHTDCIAYLKKVGAL